MGTDIHCAIEVRDDVRRAPWSRSLLTTSTWKFDRPLDLGRNYTLFGILCGYSGFENPISPPRDLPTDRDPASRTSFNEDGTIDDSDYDYFGDHSYSWLTLGELRAFDWDRSITECGSIPLRDVDARGEPDPYGNGPFESYVEWRAKPPRCPPRCSSGGERLVLDLRDIAQIDPPAHGDARARLVNKLADERRLADYFIAHPNEMPSPVERARWTGGGTETRPRTAWAYIAWTRLAREICPQFYAWLIEQTAHNDELRLVFGLDS